MIFVDTGPLLGRYLKDDQYHHKATKAWEDIGRRKEPCSTSNFVLDEVFTLLARRAGHAFAVDRARSLYASSVFTIVRPLEEEEIEALDLLAKFEDQDVSFTDCVSFALMRRRRLKRAFTFDRHFRHAGFEVWP